MCDVILTIINDPRGQIFSRKFKFEDIFDMSLEGDSHEVEVTPNLESLITFGMSLEGVISLYTSSSYLIWR
jgi:hypothetical protein